jgi:alginate O-acetyltransferase complex protein AlgI
VRYADICEKIEKRTHDIDKIANGIIRFVIGLGKKVLLANMLGELCVIFRESNEKSVLFYWMYAIAFALQIYFDFSGYSDMAIGLGKILGFDFLENFNYPYISKSITEFWRRWHISLGTWFRDYVYIPLGGSRVKKSRAYMNILIVWMLTGLWHGAAWNFVIWGLYFAVLLIIEKRLLLKQLEKSRVWGHIYVCVLVILSFVIFNASSMGQVFSDIGGMFGAGGVPLISAEAVYYLKSYAVTLGLAIVGATPIPKHVAGRIKCVKYLEPIVVLVLLVVITACLVDGSFNPFLYFRF